MSDQKVYTFKITNEQASSYKRLDHFLNDQFPEISRSFLKNLFENNLITIDTSDKLTLNRMPKENITVTVILPAPREATAKAENIPLEILYEDEHLIFINKPAGMVVHPAPGNYEGTLVNAILHHCDDLTGVGDEKRPGIVHRLDKGTSGVMIIAKNQKTHEGLTELFAKHDLDRYYEAIVVGNKLPQGGRLESTIGRHPQNRLKMAAHVRGGKNAITHYKVIKNYRLFSHVECKLETGRTHQIRVHLSTLLNSHILMDPLYGNPKQDIIRLGTPYEEILSKYEHPFLHAKILGIKHPITGEYLRFEVPAPSEFQKILQIGIENEQ